MSNDHAAKDDENGMCDCAGTTYMGSILTTLRWDGARSRLARCLRRGANAIVTNNEGVCDEIDVRTGRANFEPI